MRLVIPQVVPVIHNSGLNHNSTGWSIVVLPRFQRFKDQRLGGLRNELAFMRSKWDSQRNSPTSEKFNPGDSKPVWVTSTFWWFNFFTGRWCWSMGWPAVCALAICFKALQQNLMSFSFCFDLFTLVSNDLKIRFVQRIALTSSNLSLHRCTQMLLVNCFYPPWTHWEVHVKVCVGHLTLRYIFSTAPWALKFSVSWHISGFGVKIWEPQKMAECIDRDSWKSQLCSFFLGFWGKLPWWIIHTFHISPWCFMTFSKLGVSEFGDHPNGWSINYFSFQIHRCYLKSITTWWCFT